MICEPEGKVDVHGRRKFGLLAPMLVVAGAASTGTVSAAENCIIPMAKNYIENIALDPSQAFLALPKNDLSFVYFFRTLSVNGSIARRSIVKIVPLANRRQRVLIGQGLARAVAACNARYGETAARVVDTVRDISDREVTRSFTRFLTDSSPDPTAAVSLTTTSPGDAATGGIDVGALPDIMVPVKKLSPASVDAFRLD